MPARDNIDYDDVWRLYYEYFQRKYRFTFDQSIHDKVSEMVHVQMNLLKNALINEGLSSKDADAVIIDSIIQFLEHHYATLNGEKQSSSKCLKRSK